MPIIKSFIGDSRTGLTDAAVDIYITRELMRGYTLDFSLGVTNPFIKKLGESTVLECEGQKFDLTHIEIETGSSNSVGVQSEHVSYRLNNYSVPEGYAFVGTVAEIANDILSVSGANAEFSIGECVNKEICSLELGNENEATARSAIIALNALGVEIDFDNFVIGIYERIGKEREEPFSFNNNLISLKRTWEKGNGWTYEAEIAARSCDCGDDVKLYDDILKDTVDRRVICYKKCVDDPTKDSYTLGVFALDSASQAIETETAIANSVQLGKKYNNISLTHTEGFKATNLSDTLRVLMNAQDCFAVQVNDGNGWKTVNSLEEFGLLIDRLTTPDAKNKFYARVGKISSGDEYGIQLVAVKSGGTEEVILEIGQIDDSYSPVIYSELPINIKTKNSIVLDAEYIELNDSWHYTGSFYYVKEVLSNGGATFGKITVENGLITEVT